MPRKTTEDFSKLSVYVPQSRLAHQPLERLQRLAKKRDRSMNYLAVQAIIDYLERQERKS